MCLPAIVCGLLFFDQGPAIPIWAESELKETIAEFGRIRKELESEPFANHNLGLAQAALSTAKKSRTYVNVYKAIWRWLAAGEGSANGPEVEKLWALLPPSEYEVARLHFLWDGELTKHNLIPLSTRLLRKNPNDVAVLCRSVIWKTFVRRFQDIRKARDLAAAALAIEKSGRTYYAYAISRMYCEDGKPVPPNKADGRIAKEYFRKYLNAPGPKPMKNPAIGLIKWLEDRGY